MWIYSEMQHFHIFAKKTKYSVEIILRGISSLILIHCYFGLWFNAALTSEILSITVPTCSSGSWPMCATTKCHTQVHIFVLGQARPGNPFRHLPHTWECCYDGSRSQARTKVYHTLWVLNPGTCVQIHYAICYIGLIISLLILLYQRNMNPLPWFIYENFCL